MSFSSLSDDIPNTGKVGPVDNFYVSDNCVSATTNNINCDILARCIVDCVLAVGYMRDAKKYPTIIQ